ncbi:hypothetical protein BD779DRAFT_1682055 [Infundibulicybe gibba]|nr:hypothetical protein BD779DRAFT_1682055 [Infundibulicybe gibba]
MPGLLSLANELIAKIADQLETCKEFRGTCKQIDHIISPKLLSYIVIDVNGERIDLGISQLEALANGSTRAGEYARTVEIRHLAPHHDPNYTGRSELLNGRWVLKLEPQDPKVDWAYRKIRELLPAALSALVGARFVIWTMVNKSPVAVSEFLSTLPSLQTLCLMMPVASMTPVQPRPQPRLSQISNLTELTVRGYHDDFVAKIVGNSPKLAHLDLEYPGFQGVVKDIPTLHDLFKTVPYDHPLQLLYLRIRGYCIRFDRETLPHLRLLRSLEFNAVPPILGHERLEYTQSLLKVLDTSASSLSETWEVIGREELPIEAVVTPINDAVLNYLAAADGIRKLALTEALTRVNDTALNPLAHRETSTKAENEVLAHGFFTRVLPQHSKTLVSLSLPMNFGGAWFIGPHNTDALLECTQLVELSIPVDTTDSSGVEKASLDDVMEEILGMAARLPNLYQLELFTGFVEDFWHGLIVPTRPNDTAQILSESITSFGPVDLGTHPQLIGSMGDKFRPQRDSCGVVKYIHCLS